MAIKAYTRALEGSPDGLFNLAVSLEIPPFQRPYVWQKDRHWVPLWEDVQNLADAVFEATSGGETSLQEGQDPTPAHFLGAVVLHRWSGELGAIPVYRVVDGQQRLTTLQLLLHATKVAYEERECVQVGRLSDLVFNNPNRTNGEADLELKIVPTRANRTEFRHVMQGKPLTSSQSGSQIVAAHEYFYERICEWLDGNDEGTVQGRANAMHTALAQLLQIVVIELDHTADPQIIFETLNARGEPLLQSDLVRNYIFYVAERQGYSPDVVASDWLARYDDRWWKVRVSQGRTRRERVEQFLNYWLVMRVAREVKAGDIFQTFRQHVDDLNDDIREIVDAMDQSAHHYVHVVDAHPDSLAATQLQRLRTLDAGAVTPVILWFMSHMPTERADITDRAIRVLESYYVRRVLCGFASMGMNKVMHGALEHLDPTHPTSAADALVQYLQAQTTERRVWPTDDALRSALQRRRIDSMARPKLTVVLEALAKKIVSPKSEKFDYSSLTVEHVMPQKWRTEKWDPPTNELAEAGETAEMVRDRMIHTIGNLTLVTGPLNAALSNDPWSEKRAQIDEYSGLPINKDLVTHAGDVWDEAAIIARSKRLAEIAIQIWPSPDAI